MGSRTVDWSNLPEEIVQVLGYHLDAQGWAAARRTCKGWKNITADIKLLEVDLEQCAHRWMMVTTCVARLFPHLSCIVLLVGNRISPAVFAERMEALSITSMKLQELELRFVYVTNPIIGSWLEDLSGVTSLRQLKVLRLAGGATPPASFFERLTVLRQLEVLEFLPGVYGQLLNDMDVDMASANADDIRSGDGGLCDVHMSAIGKLTQLKQLTVKVHPGECTPAGLSGLAALGLLNRLEQLALYDSELPACCLAGWLKLATQLTALQLGLSNVEDLAPLAKLPKLKELSLDTAFLPELRELVYAAARGNIPTSGPGALTGLCLLDQAVSSPLQLASLSQLSSLAELVMVNPLREPPASLDDNGNEAAAAAAAAAAGHQQQQQQQDLAIDIAALSGLRSLQLLQIDLKHSQQQQQNPDLNPIQVPEPLQLRFGETAVQQLAAAWGNLVTLDLSGFTVDMLPSAAVAGFSSFKALRHLSIMAAEVLGTGGPGGVQQQGLGLQQYDVQLARNVAWWQLPNGLVSLCLSHFDLTGVSGSSSGSSEVVLGGSSSCNQPPVAVPCSDTCCMAAQHDEKQQQQQPPQRQYSPSGLSSRVQHLINPQLSPLRPLVKRREGQQQQQQGADRANSSSSTRNGNSSQGGDSGGRSAAAVAAAAAAAAAAARPGDAAAEAAAAVPCACIARVASQFSSLQALWLEHCTLPCNFVAACLPAAAPHLESLGLLHVHGTCPAELASTLSGLSGLTSLRLIPADHGLGGLGQLVALKHLKKLNIRLAHLEACDLSVLPKLRSLFCLALAAPLAEGGRLRPGLPAAAVKLAQVVEVVKDSLPYCDVELQQDHTA